MASKEPRNGLSMGPKAAQAKRRALERARAAGVPVNLSRSPKGGNPKVSKQFSQVFGEGALEAELYSAGEVVPVWEHLQDYDLTRHEDRVAYRHTLMELRAKALIDARDVEVFLRLARDQAKDATENAADRPPSITFVPVTSRSQAKEIERRREALEDEDPDAAVLAAGEGEL